MNRQLDQQILLDIAEVLQKPKNDGYLLAGAICVQSGYYPPETVIIWTTDDEGESDEHLEGLSRNALRGLLRILRVYNHDPEDFQEALDELVAEALEAENPPSAEAYQHMHRLPEAARSVPRNPATASVLDEVRRERQKQIAKGFDKGHDDAHTDGSLISAARCLAAGSAAHGWPWDGTLWLKWRDYSRRRQLLMAASLLVAEIERLDRRPELTLFDEEESTGS